MSYFASSSNMSSSNKAMDLRFKNVLCKCQCKAAIRVSETEKNPGKLFYTCMGVSGKHCNFFQWAHPYNLGEYTSKDGETNARHEESQKDHARVLNEVEIVSRFAQLESTQVLINSKFEDIRNMMKLIVIFLFVVIFAILFSTK